MEQFVAVAAAHFLALLIPGVDFFLIVRTSLRHGRVPAAMVCVGIALANALFISAGFASGLLNPKNALFYVSLAAAVAPAPAGSLIFYGTWMFTVVLTWDLLLAFALGAPRTLGALQRVLPWISATAGLVLVALGVTMVARGLTALWA